MRYLTPLTILVGCYLAGVAAVQGAGVAQSKSQFTYKERSGKLTSASLVSEGEKRRIVHPVGKVDRRLDPRLMRAASIAQERAHARSKSRCWRYVKEALLAAGVIKSRPTTALAKQAGDELVRDHGFKKLPVRDPYAAPVGAVLVYYKGKNRPGHVELRTKTGFASDFRTKDACRYPLLGAYAKSS